MHECKFLTWKSGDLPKSEKYKKLQPAKYYGREELSDRQLRQYDIACGLGNDTISTPFPTWEHRDTGKTVNSRLDQHHERIGTPLFYNKNHNYKGDV